MSKTENAIAIVITNERKKGYHHNVLKLNAEAGMEDAQTSYEAQLLSSSTLSALFYLRRRRLKILQSGPNHQSCYNLVCLTKKKQKEKISRLNGLDSSPLS